MIFSAILATFLIKGSVQDFNVVDFSDCSCSGHKQVVPSDRHFGQGTEHHNWLRI